MTRRALKFGSNLGEFTFEVVAFDGEDACLESYHSLAFKELRSPEKKDRIFKDLLSLIRHAEAGEFLFPIVIRFLVRVKNEVLSSLKFADFEYWLNHGSKLTERENAHVRGLIAGKWVFRDAYTSLFPIGKQKSYGGPHITTAHRSPDLDTTVCSFWVWLEAFAARVSKSSVTRWNVPGGKPSLEEIQQLFDPIFSDGLFDLLADPYSTLSVHAMDLMTPEGMKQCQLHELSVQRDIEDRQKTAMIVVDKQQKFIVDWRSMDVVTVRGYVNHIAASLRFMESYFLTSLTQLLARPTLTRADLEGELHKILETKFSETEPGSLLTLRETTIVNQIFIDVLGIFSGMESTLEEFAKRASELDLGRFEKFFSDLEKLLDKSNFDASGQIISDRTKLFSILSMISMSFSSAILQVRREIDTLKVASEIKQKVLGKKPVTLKANTSLSEMRKLIQSYGHLTVVEDGLAVGVVYDVDIMRESVASASLCDFSNRVDTKVPEEIQVITCIDHHKVHLISKVPAMICTLDAQSSNTILAWKFFDHSDRFCCMGLDLQEIGKQLSDLETLPRTPATIRIQHRLLQQQSLHLQNREWFISADREYIAYMHFLYAIFDDTDLLSKVTRTDVECVVQLVNRMKSIALNRVVEVVDLDDIPLDGNYPTAAARKLLQHEELYSLYRKVFEAREQSADEVIKQCASSDAAAFFRDTKVISRFRIGQYKHFQSNYPMLECHLTELMDQWLSQSLSFYTSSHETNVHMMMLSTIHSASDVYQQQFTRPQYDDQIWVFIPKGNDSAYTRLGEFISRFTAQEKVRLAIQGVEIYGDEPARYEQLFDQYAHIPLEVDVKPGTSETLAVFKVVPGSLNSRKADLSVHIQ